MSQVDEWGTTSNQDFELDGGGVGSEDLGGAGSIKQEGWYHFEVTDVVAELETVGKKGGEKSPSVRLDLTVLETVKGQAAAGAKHYHRLYVGAKGGGPAADGSRNNVLRFGLGLGLLKEVETDGRHSIVDAVSGSASINMATLLRAKGMQCCAKIELQKDDTGKYGDKYEIPFSRVYTVDHPEVAKVAKNKAALAMIGKGAAASAAAGAAVGAAPAGKFVPPTPPVDTSPGISDDDLADL